MPVGPWLLRTRKLGLYIYTTLVLALRTETNRESMPVTPTDQWSEREREREPVICFRERKRDGETNKTSVCAVWLVHRSVQFQQWRLGCHSCWPLFSKGTTYSLIHSSSNLLISGLLCGKVVLGIVDDQWILLASVSFLFMLSDEENWYFFA